MIDDTTQVASPFEPISAGQEPPPVDGWKGPTPSPSEEMDRRAEKFNAAIEKRRAEFNRAIEEAAAKKQAKRDEFDKVVYETQRRKAESEGLPKRNPIETMTGGRFGEEGVQVIPLPIVDPVDEYGIPRPPGVIREETEKIQKERIGKLASTISKSGGKSYRDYWIERLPFVGAFASAASNTLVSDSINVLMNGHPSEKDYENVAAFIKQQEKDRGKGFWSNVWDMASSLPGFAVEFAATGGVFKAGEAATSSLMSRMLGKAAESAVGRMSQRIVAGTVGAMAQTAANPIRVAESITSRGLQDSFVMVRDEDGMPQYWLKKPEEGVSETAVRGSIGAFFEIATEHMGGPIGRKMRWLGGKLGADKFADAVMKYAPNFVKGQRAEAVTRIFNAVGYNGPIPEVAEEYIGSILNSAVGNQPWDQAIPSMQKTLEMLTAFSIPSLATMAFKERNPNAKLEDVPENPTRQQIKDMLGDDAPNLTADERAEVATAIRTELADQGDQNASEVGQAAEVHGNVQQSEGSQEGEGQVPAGQGGAGVREEEVADRTEPDRTGPDDGPLASEAQVAAQKEDTNVADVNRTEADTTGPDRTAAPPAVEAGEQAKESAASPDVAKQTQTETPSEVQVKAEAQGQGQEESLLNQPEQGAGETPPAAPSTPIRQSPLGDETSIKNAVTDQKREALGLPPIMSAAQRAWGTIWDSVMSESQEVIDGFVQALRANPVAVDDIGDARLLRKQVELETTYEENVNKLDAARKAGDSVEVASLEQLTSTQLAELDGLYALDRMVGTAQGRGLNARKMLAGHDFSLKRLAQRKQKALGRQLSSEEMTELSEMSKKLADLQARYDALEKSKAAAPIDDLIDSAKKEKPKRVAKARADLNKAWADFQKVAAGKLFANPIDPELLTAAVKLAAGYIRLGVAKVGDFYDRVRERYGLKELNDDQKKALWQAWAIASANADNEKAEKRQAKIDSAKESMQTEDDPIIRDTKLRDLTREILYEGVESGEVETRDQGVEYVHGEIGELLGMTPEDVAHALSGIGIFREATKDDVKKTVLGYASELQQLEKLKYMAAGQAPPITGDQRLPPTDEYRRLTKLVNEAKKKGGFVTTDPARQLKSALASIETRLRNAISDVRKEIETKQRLVKTKTPSPTSPTIEDLRRELAALREEHARIFQKRGMTDAQRLRAALASKDRLIAEYQRRIDQQDFEPKKKRPPVDSPELREKNAKLEELKAAYEELKLLANPKATQEERDIAAYTRSLWRRYNFWADKADLVGFPKPPKKPDRKLTDEQIVIRNQIENEKVRYQHAIEQELRRNRTTVQKIFGGIMDAADILRIVQLGLEFSIAGLQGGLYWVGHPIKGTFAAGRMLKAWGSENEFHRMQLEMETDELVKSGATKRWGLSLIEPGDPLNPHEEWYHSRFIEKLPLAKRFDRAATTSMNTIRLGMLKSLVYALGGKDGLTDEQGKVLANAVNVWTGRGNMGRFQSSIVDMARVFLAPRWVVSRFQTVLGQPLWSGDKATRKAIAAEYARTILGYSTIISALSVAASMYGDDSFYVEFDPRSSDFLKVVIGNTRLDFLAGLSQATVFMARMALGEVKRQTGEVVAMREGARPLEWLRDMTGESDLTRPRVQSGLGRDTLFQFLSYKASPITQGLMTLISGEDAVGNKVPPWMIPIRMGMPITHESIVEAMMDMGVPEGAALAVPAMFGLNPNTYKMKPDSFLSSVRRLGPTELQRGVARITKDDNVEMKDGRVLSGDEFRIQVYGRILSDLTAPAPKQNAKNYDEVEDDRERARLLLEALMLDDGDALYYLDEYLKSQKRTTDNRFERRSRLNRELIGGPSR